MFIFSRRVFHLQLRGTQRSLSKCRFLNVKSEMSASVLNLVPCGESVVPVFFGFLRAEAEAVLEQRPLSVKHCS